MVENPQLSDHSLNLLMIRHAHRDVSLRSLDNGLSEKGLKQRAKLTEEFFTHFPQESNSQKWNNLLSSPKIRCQETLYGLEAELNSPIVIDEALNEQQATESYEAFQNRISNFIQRLKKAGGNYVLCSHGDWLPEFHQQIFHQDLHFRKAEAILYSHDKAVGTWTQRPIFLRKP